MNPQVILLLAKIFFENLVTFSCHPPDRRMFPGEIMGSVYGR